MSYFGNLNLSNDNLIDLADPHSLKTNFNVLGLTAVTTSTIAGNFIYIFEGSSTTGRKLLKAAITDPRNVFPVCQVGDGYRYGGITVTEGTQMFILGGYTTAGAASSTIYSANITSPESWTLRSETLVEALKETSYAKVSTTHYLFGGNNGAVTNKIYLSSNLTTWGTSGSTLPISVSRSSIATIGSFMYLFGGHNGTSSITTILRAATASPTSWTSVGNLSAARSSAHVAVPGDGYVYLIGGIDGAGSSTNTVLRATVADPLTWSSSVATLGATKSAGTLQIADGYVNLYGGNISTRTIEVAKTSSMLTWTSVDGYMPAGVYAATPMTLEVAGESRIYLFGGKDAGGAINRIVYTTKKNPTMIINDGYTLPVNLGDGGIIRVNGNLFIVAGTLGVNGNIYTASVANPTSWSLSNSNGPSLTGGKIFITPNNYVYWIAGLNSGGTPQSSCFRSSCNGTRDLVDWTSISNFPIPLGGFELGVFGNYVYTFGGLTSGSSVTANIYRCSLNELDTGNWINVGSLATARYYMSSFISNGYFYLFGGATGVSNTSNTLQSCPIRDLEGGVPIATVNMTNTTIAGGFGAAATTSANGTIYMYGGLAGGASGSTVIQKTVLSSKYGLLAQDIVENTQSVPCINLKTGNISSYNQFHQLGYLPWLTNEKIVKF